LGTKLPLQSKVESRKSIPLKKLWKKRKKHVKSLTWFTILLYDQNLQRKTNKKRVSPSSPSCSLSLHKLWRMRFLIRFVEI